MKSYALRGSIFDETRGLDEAFASEAGQHLEFRIGVPEPQEFAQVLAGMANADGGMVFIGYDGAERRIVGLYDPAGFPKRVEAAVSWIEPRLLVLTNVPFHRAIPIGAILVSSRKAHEPPFAVLPRRDLFTRIGARTVRWEDPNVTHFAVPLDGPALVNLGDVLAVLYPDRESSRRVVVGAGMDAKMINFNDAAAINWFHILEHAQRESQDRLVRVIEHARREFPRNDALRRLLAGPPYAADTEVSGK